MSTSTDAKETFATGAQRDTRAGKGRYDLISTHAMKRLALRLEQGAAHYGDRNWEKGMPLMRCVDSLKRHLDQWIEGSLSEDHLAGVLFNAMALADMDTRIERGELPESLDDRPWRTAPQARRCPICKQTKPANDFISTRCVACWTGTQPPIEQPAAARMCMECGYEQGTNTTCIDCMAFGGANP